MKPSLGGRINHIAAWMILAILIVPSLVSFPASITAKTYLSLPWEGVSLQHFRNLLIGQEHIQAKGQHQYREQRTQQTTGIHRYVAQLPPA